MTVNNYFYPKEVCVDCRARHQRAIESLGLFKCSFKLCQECIDRAVSEKKKILQERIKNEGLRSRNVRRGITNRQ